ncbi:MAG: sulfatase [Lentisphaerae bacterium]|nr:sulfatase [Lentisphaerota bacterium]
MKTPNIIYVICHDIGRHVGCYGAGVSSPNLDRIGRDGVVFENAFCNSPACSPSRGCAMTGQYAHTSGGVGLSHRGFPLAPTVKTVTDYFNAGGYETAHFGFQHERHDPRDNRYQVEGSAATWQDHYCENAFDKALAYLAERRKAGRPFYLNVGTIEVHASRWQGVYEDNRLPVYGPHQPDPDDVKLPFFMPDHPRIRREFAKFEAAIRYYDQQVGRFYDGLREMGFLDNSIVVFTTDHGISGLRAKGTIYDPGVEIMTLMHFPEASRNGRRYGELIQNIDFAPTVLDFAGLPVPESMQGRSFKDLVTGGKYCPHEHLFIERNSHGGTYDRMRAVRTRDMHYIRNFEPRPLREWLPHEVEHRIGDTYERWMGELWPAPSEPRPAEELYVLTDDPREWTNPRLYRADAPRGHRRHQPGGDRDARSAPAVLHLRRRRRTAHADGRGRVGPALELHVRPGPRREHLPAGPHHGGRIVRPRLVLPHALRVPAAGALHIAHRRRFRRHRRHRRRFRAQGRGETDGGVADRRHRRALRTPCRRPAVPGRRRVLHRQPPRPGPRAHPAVRSAHLCFERRRCGDDAAI